MSFITKRERVFNEYELFDLPARNEGKLKAYASCTDARAWSHFCSDKTEHLVEIIKRNNETCRPKYVPTGVIVDTLMVAKNAEITRLRRKIEEFEQMLAAYDQLELSSEQKEEIAKAHASIKAANKELDELCLDLDLSGFTEGIDSEAFETGKSSGDEPSRYKTTETSRTTKSLETRTMDPESPNVESKGVQMDLSCSCDASTNAVDKRVDDMQDCIITKDAKLNAMKNTIAVLENDLSGPYYVYAHIYTALEKIFCILCQNDKYKQYLNLLTAGKDIRCINIKGKIFYKLKVLEKFSLALIAPCTQDFASMPMVDCACFHVEIEPRIESAFALTSSECTLKPSVDKKRAHLVADIIENDEMKEILSRDDSSIRQDEDQLDFCIETDPYSINTENLKRLKNLQANYDDLMSCYENVLNEKDCLQLRCNKYEGLQNELECLKNQLREYNSLWSEKEHYQKRSADLDSLKEQYLILVDETTSLESQLKAEAEINNIKTKTIEELRDDNFLLEQKVNEAMIAFDKEKNSMLCKLKAAECRILCQDEQIRSLSSQIDNLLEQGHEQSREDDKQSITLLDEIESLKEQIKNLKDAIVCNDEEKQEFQNIFQEKLNLITQLRKEIEDWKSTYEKILDRNDYLEKYTENICNEVHRLEQDNRLLARDIEEKTTAFENLMNVTHNKSQQINNLVDEIETKTIEYNNLLSQIEELKNDYNNGITSFENEKKMAIASLVLAKQESQELLDIVRDNTLIKKEKGVTEPIGSQQLRTPLDTHEDSNSILIQEIQRLREINNIAVSNVKDMNNEKNQYKHALDLSVKESGVLKEKLSNFEIISQQLRNLQQSHENILNDKNKLENELMEKEINLSKALNSIDLSKKQSDELIERLQQSDNLKNDIIKLNESYQKLFNEKISLQNALFDKNRELATLLKSLNSLKSENERLLQNTNKTELLEKQLNDLNSAYHSILLDKTTLQNDYDSKSEILSNLFNTLENKIDENQHLSQELNNLENDKLSKENIIKSMQNENVSTQATLEIMKRDSKELVDKIKFYKHIEDEFNKLNLEHNQMMALNKKMQIELNKYQEYSKKLEDQISALNNESQLLESHSEDLKNELITTKTELIQKSSFTMQSSEEILNEIAKMKKEKLQNQIKVRELRDKLEDSEKKMSDLIEIVIAREDRIAILENHINALQDEVKRLQRDLSGAVDVGEQIKDISYQKIDDSLKSMEAHHSKATHNMKMEVAKLQHQKESLENQLSSTQIRSEENSLENHKFKSQLMKLQTEREIIVTDIKQLELQFVGDTILAPDNCGIEEVLASLHKIRKCFDEKHSKSITLEQTLLKVQNSSELLISKAEEAKKLVEKEKIKTVNEKEEVIKDKQNMENQLRELKEKLQKQAFDDKTIIKDLEGEIHNQKLIIEKINKSTQDYIGKLKEEMQSLRSLYEDSIAKVTELQQKLNDSTKDNNELLKIVNKTKLNLETKSKEVEDLQTELNAVRKKPDSRSIGCQAKSFIVESITTQTDNTLEHNTLIHLKTDDDENDPKYIFEENLGLLNVNKINRSKYIIETDQNQKPQTINEVQILTAKVEPTFDFLRNSYLNYKIQQLSIGKLDQYSIPCITDESDENSSASPLLIDIYSKKRDSAEISATNNKIFQKIGLQSNDEPTTSGKVNNSESSDGTSKQDNNNTFSISTLSKSKEKDLLVIYKDSDSLEHVSQPARINSINMQVQSKDKKEMNRKYRNKKSSAYSEDIDGEYDDIKPKIKINMPRADQASSSVVSLSEAENKSLNSYVTETHSIPKRYSTSELTNKTTERFRTSTHTALNVDHNYVSNVMKKQSESEHKLLRVNADSLLVNNKESTPNFDNTQLGDSQEKQTNLENKKELKHSNQSSSKNRYFKQNNKYKKLDDMLFVDINLNSSSSKIFTNQFKTASSTSKLITRRNSDERSEKVLVDRDIMVSLNGSQEYELKINEMTKAMESMEKDFKKKVEVIKVQYDRHIKNIINEHNEGVKSLQLLHEETLHDIFKVHENEVENLRSMSIEAMRKVDKLEKENRSLKTKTGAGGSMCLDEEPTNIAPAEVKKRKRPRGDKTLIKTTVEAFNLKPKHKIHGPCTCSPDINLSDTIRNIFKMVDVEHRELAEQTYMKHIANKMINGNIKTLDAEELSFLHLKVCRMWKTKVNKQEALQKKIDTLECEMVNKRRHAQQHFAELDRKVAEERQRLKEVREAICLNEPLEPHVAMEEPPLKASLVETSEEVLISDAEKEMLPCNCNSRTGLRVSERRSAGDVAPDLASIRAPPRRLRNDISRAVIARLDGVERREKKIYTDELPTRLRKTHEKLISRAPKK